MSGLPKFNYPAFMEAQTELIKAGYEVLNPAAIDYIFPKTCEHLGMVAGCEVCDERDWKWYMRRSIPMVCQADGLAMLPRWQMSRGARYERELAQEVLGMPVKMVMGWLQSVKEEDLL
jgi:hypothetical protein